MSRRRPFTYSSESPAIAEASAKMSARVLLALIVVVACQTSCAQRQEGAVQRRMTVRSNVPGAQVYVDNYEIGRTPVSTDFTYYGDRDVRLVKDGYETLKVRQPVNAPWYQFPGIDFISENLWPFEIRDERNFNYQMQPQYLVPTETILSRAEEMRTANNASIASPVATQAVATQPVVVTPGTTVAPPGYVVPPAGAVAPPASPYAPQNPTGAPRL